MNSDTQSRDLTKLLLKLTVVATFLILLVFSPAVIRSSTGFILIGLSLVSLALLSIPLFVRRDYNTFEPLTFILLLFLFGAPFKILYVLYYGSTNHYIAERLLLWKDVSSLTKGTAVMTAGLACLVIGYCLPFKASLPKALFLPRVQAWNGRKTFLICLLISIVSGAFLVAFIGSAGISFSNLSEKRFSEEAGSGAARIHMLKYYLYRGAALSKFAVYLLYVHVLTNRKSITSLTGAMCGLAVLQTIALFFVINSRAGIALMVLDLLVIAHYIKGRIPPAALGSSLLMIFILIVAVLFGRSETDLSEALEKTIAGRDMMDISKTCHIINAVPHQIDYRYGETIFGWVAAPIPSSMWPGKPMWAGRGIYLLTNVYGDKGGIAGIPPGLVAELFWNFDIYGVVIGMFFTGLLLRLIYTCFESVGRTPTSVLIYTVVVTRFALFSLGNDLGTGFVKTGLDLVPLLFLICLVGEWRSRDQAPQAIGSES